MRFLRALKRTPWPISEVVDGEGQVVHQIAKGISKRTVGAVGCVLGLGGGLLVRREVLCVLREASRLEGAW